MAGLPLRVHGRRDGTTYVDREYLLVGVRPQDAYLSPCSVRTWLWADSPFNIHVCGYWDDYGQAVRVRKDGYRTAVQSFGPSWRIDFEVVRN